MNGMEVPMRSIVFACFAGSWLVGCSSDAIAPCTTCTDDGGDASAPMDAAGDVVVPMNCDLAKDPSDSPACIDDGIGVFVDGMAGDDNNPGTKAKPLKTIAKGIQAAGAKPRVYVCAGTYAEDVVLGQQNAVSIYGGLVCGAWTYSPAARPKIGATTMAFKVDGASKPVVFADLTLASIDATTPSGSSIAALVNGSTDVTFRRVSFQAGAGMSGTSGTTGTNWSAVQQSDAKIAGNAGNGTSGGGTHACMLCTDSVNSTGGSGGGGGLTPGNGNAGAPNLNGMNPNDGAGGGSGCTAGHNGKEAAAAANASGASTLGTLDAAGWTPSSGLDGKNGGPGQGGGGGGGGTSVNGGGGGGGGCGGCGGAAGKGGSGGGGSVGLAIVSSMVTVVASDMSAKAGGSGGNGSAGQAGQAPGYAGNAASPGCNGGNGGGGGAGGAGGGGAGGISAGIVVKGAMMPTVDMATTMIVGAAGTKGNGGAAGANDGIAGNASALLQLP
jgi:hypothetical protein